MNHKQYLDIKNHILLEHAYEEDKKVLDAFHRVREGKKFSVNDLHVVQKTLANQPNVRSPDRVHSLDENILLLEHRANISRDNISQSSKRLKKRGLDIDRLRRQRRLQHEKQKRKKEELEQH